MTPAPERFLVIRLSAIGDCVHCSAAVRALREARPDAFIAWMVEPKSAAVVVGSALVDEVILWDRKKDPLLTPRGLVGMWKRLRPYRFDTALDFQGLGRSAIVSLLSGARQRIGFVDSREAGSLAANVPCGTRASDTWAIRKYMELLEPLHIHPETARMDVPVSDEARAEAAAAVRAAGLEGKRLLGLQLRGSWPNKRWPAARFAEVSERALARWGLVPALIGGPDDRADAEDVISRYAGPYLDAVGGLSLAGSIGLVERCSALIGPDTGILHIAATLGVPSVALFGPTSGPVVAPRGEHVRLHYHALPCGPCGRRPTCEGRYDCMALITADDVFGSLVSLLG